jgi:hypothetical protein
MLHLSSFDLSRLFRKYSGGYLGCHDDQKVAEQRHHQVVTRTVHKARYGEAREPAAAEKNQTTNDG